MALGHWATDYLGPHDAGSSGGGSGDGSGGGNYFDVELSVVPTESGGATDFTCNRTYDELEAAIENDSVFRVWLNTEFSTPSFGTPFAFSVVQEDSKITFAVLAIADVQADNGALTYTKIGIVVEVTEDSVTGDFYPATDVTE